MGDFVMSEELRWVLDDKSAGLFGKITLKSSSVDRTHGFSLIYHMTSVIWDRYNQTPSFILLCGFIVLCVLPPDSLTPQATGLRPIRVTRPLCVQAHLSEIGVL